MKELNELLPLSSFTTVEEARNFEHRIDTFKITEGLAKQYLLTPGNVVDPAYPDKWAYMRSLRNNLTHPLSSIIDIFLTRLESNGYFDVDPDHAAGLANIQLAYGLVGSLFVDTDDANAFLNLSIKVDKPYKDVTAEEHAEARNPTPTLAETEVTYPSETYIIKAAGQAFEFDIIVTDGSTDNIWDIRLEVCEVDQGQHDPANWFDMGKVFTPIRQGMGTKTKYQIESNSKRTKTYNRFYVTPRKACDFTVSVKAV